MPSALTDRTTTVASIWPCMRYPLICPSDGSARSRLTCAPGCNAGPLACSAHETNFSTLDDGESSSVNGKTLVACHVCKTRWSMNKESGQLTTQNRADFLDQHCKHGLFLSLRRNGQPLLQRHRE